MDKKKQIEEMAKTLCGEKEHTCEKCDSCDMCEFWLEASTLYNAGYRKQSEPISCGHEKGGGWISVDERLPDCEQAEESEAVLFITKQGFMYTGYYGCGGIYHDRYFREYKNSTEGYDISNVTHWMHLPEPPDMNGGTE